MRGMGPAVVAAEAAIQETLAVGQAGYDKAPRPRFVLREIEGEPGARMSAILEPGNAPSWIAAFAAMTNSVAGLGRGGGCNAGLIHHSRT